MLMARIISSPATRGTKVYVGYATANGIIAASDFSDYNRAATRLCRNTNNMSASDFIRLDSKTDFLLFVTDAYEPFQLMCFNQTDEPSPCSTR